MRIQNPVVQRTASMEHRVDAIQASRRPIPSPTPMRTAWRRRTNPLTTCASAAKTAGRTRPTPRWFMWPCFRAISSGLRKRLLAHRHRGLHYVILSAPGHPI